MSMFSLLTLIALTRYRLFNMEEFISIGRLIDNLTDIVLAVNKRNEIVFVNRDGGAQLGYSIAELQGENIFNILREQDRERFTSEVMLPASRGLHVQNDAVALIRKDGSVVQVSIVADELENESGHVGVLLLARDISELKNSIDLIESQRAYLRQLFDASPLAMAMVGIDGVALDVNSAFEKIFQYSKENVTGSILADLIIPEEFRNETRKQWENANKPRYIQFETKRRRRDGDIFDVCISMYPIQIANKIHGVYSIYEDITDRKSHERQLKKKNEELTKINNEMDKFVYSISHDIRSPLMSTLGVINMAESETLTESDYKMYLDMIKQNIDRLDTFTSSTILYYKNTREDVIPASIDFDGLINSIIEMLRYQEDARDMDFVVEVNVKGNRFFSDVNKLQVIFNNLIANAIKYRKHSQETSYLKIKVDIEEQSASIVIEDNGEGIDESRLQDIFSMFSRFSQRSNGSGLGLYIVKEVIELLNGTIEVHSTPGKGTSFTLGIPSCVQVEAEVV